MPGAHSQASHTGGRVRQHRWSPHTALLLGVGGAEIPGLLLHSSVTTQEKVGLPGRGRECGVKTYDQVGTGQPDRHPREDTSSQSDLLATTSPHLLFFFPVHDFASSRFH